MKNDDDPRLLAVKQSHDAIRRNKAIARRISRKRENLARIMRIAKGAS